MKLNYTARIILFSLAWFLWLGITNKFGSDASLSLWGKDFPRIAQGIVLLFMIAPVSILFGWLCARYLPIFQSETKNNSVGTQNKAVESTTES